MILNSTIIGNQPQHLVIFHGLFGQSDNWNTLGKQFSEYYTTHLVDLRNHGKSFHDDVMTFDVMSDDILNYLNYHKLEKVFLMGHSLGGKAVMQFAILQANYILKLIVVDIAPKQYPTNQLNIFKALNSVNFDTVTTRKDVEAVLVQYISEESVRQFLLKNVFKISEARYSFRFNLAVLTKSYMANIITDTVTNGLFEGITLFIYGCKSDYIILPEDELLIKNKFPNATLKSINTGHWVQVEDPKGFFEMVMFFLN